MSYFSEFKQNFNKYLSTSDIEKLLNNYRFFLSNKAIYNLDNIILPLKIGNLKIGKDTIIFNTNSVFNCYCKHTKQCNLNKSCYAFKYCNTFKNSFVNSLISEVNFNKLSESDIINQIELKVNDSIKYIRINEQGDIKNNKELIKLNNIAKYFKSKHNIISYTYTHNKELNLSLSTDLIINTSDFSSPYNKSVLILNDFEKLSELIKLPYYNFCLGNCFNCCYCKDKYNLKSTIIVNHAKYSITDIYSKFLNESDLKKLQIKITSDNKKFLEYNF